MLAIETSEQTLNRRSSISLHPPIIGSVPEETARVARAAFPKGNLSRQIRQESESISEASFFAQWFPNVGHPAEAPWRFVLACFVQSLEGSSDRQSVEAVRSRTNVKDLLG
jgi:transposase